MDKVKEFLKNKKELLIIIGVVVILVGIILFVLINTDGEKKLKDKLETLATDYYENNYYDKISSDEATRKQILEKFASTGFTINLNSLSRYEQFTEQVKEFVNSETDEECDKEKTTITIYPKDPYGKEDYEVKVNLVCGYEE